MVPARWVCCIATNDALGEACPVVSAGAMQRIYWLGTPAARPRGRDKLAHHPPGAVRRRATTIGSALVGTPSLISGRLFYLEQLGPDAMAICHRLGWGYGGLRASKLSQPTKTLDQRALSLGPPSVSMLPRQRADPMIPVASRGFIGLEAGPDRTFRGQLRPLSRHGYGGYRATYDVASAPFVGQLRNLVTSLEATAWRSQRSASSSCLAFRRGGTALRKAQLISADADGLCLHVRTFQSTPRGT